jgi:hypothetical protein
MKIKYFNTGFVSLQYKNTNQYQSKCSKKIYKKITNFFEIIYEKILFYFYFLWAGPNPAHVAGLDPAGLTARLGKTEGHA